MQEDIKSLKYMYCQYMKKYTIMYSIYCDDIYNLVYDIYMCTYM